MKWVVAPAGVVGSHLMHAAELSVVDAHMPKSAPQSVRRRCSRAQAIEIEIDDGCRVKRQQLRQQQAANDGIAERLADFRAYAGSLMSGRAPSSAAIVVMRIGRKRSTQARWIASSAVMP